MTICQGDHRQVAASKLQLLEALPSIHIGGIRRVVGLGHGSSIFSIAIVVIIELILTSIVDGFIIESYILIVRDVGLFSLIPFIFIVGLAPVGFKGLFIEGSIAASFPW